MLYPKPAWHAEALRAIRAIAPKAKLEIQVSKGKDPEIKLSLSGVPRSKIRSALSRLSERIPET